nr:signal peptidase I [Chloroflexota bacterium]
DLTLIRLARRAVGLIRIALLVVLVVFTLFTHLAPLSGRELFIIGGGSMEPSIPLGSLVVVSRIDPMMIAAGDVVTIRADNGVVITHRVLRVVDRPEGRFVELKGDANQSSDASLVPARAIVGAADHFVPFAGFAQEYLATLPGLLSVVGFLGALSVICMLLEMVERSVRPNRSPAVELTGT